MHGAFPVVFLPSLKDFRDPRPGFVWKSAPSLSDDATSHAHGFEGYPAQQAQAQALEDRHT